MRCFNCQPCGFRVRLAHNQRVPASSPGTFLTLDVERGNFSSFQDLRVEAILPARTSKGYATSWVLRAWPPGGASEGVPHPSMGTGALPHNRLRGAINQVISCQLHLPFAVPQHRAPFALSSQSAAVSDPPISCPTPLPAVPLATGCSPALPSKFFLECNRFTSDEPPSTDCPGI